MTILSGDVELSMDNCFRFQNLGLAWLYMLEVVMRTSGTSPIGAIEIA